jgi:molybdenum cofactor biosynthesis enzyme MoaA
MNLPHQLKLPRQLTMEPVSRRHDDHCMHKNTAPDGCSCNSTPDYMNFIQFCQQIDQLPELAELHLQGAEDPLLHLHFFEMVRYAVARGIQVNAHTGLTVLPEYCAEECVRSGLPVLHIALDAASADVYHAIHGKARYDRILRNLRRLMRAKLRLNSKLPQVQLTCMVMQKNLAQLPDLVQLAHDEGITQMSVQYTPAADVGHCQGRAALHGDAGQRSLEEVSPQQISLYFELARVRAIMLGIDLQLPEVPQVRPSQGLLHERRQKSRTIRQPIRTSVTTLPQLSAALVAGGNSVPSAAVTSTQSENPLTQLVPARASAHETGQLGAAFSGMYGYRS